MSCGFAASSTTHQRQWEDFLAAYAQSLTFITQRRFSIRQRGRSMLAVRRRCGSTLSSSCSWRLGSVFFCEWERICGLGWWWSPIRRYNLCFGWGHCTVYFENAGRRKLQTCRRVLFIWCDGGTGAEDVGVPMERLCAYINYRFGRTHRSVYQAKSNWVLLYNGYTRKRPGSFQLSTLQSRHDQDNKTFPFS